MENIENVFDSMPWLFPLIGLIIIWELVWKMIALWRAARNNDLTWFVFIGIINSLAILPIIYVLTHPKKAVQSN